LISYTNKVFETEQKYVCVSRPRRFGKTIAANMLAAYYGMEDDAENLFAPFEIARDHSFHRHLNRYRVIFFNMQSFLSHATDAKDFIQKIFRKLWPEIQVEFPFVKDMVFESLSDCFDIVYDRTKEPFVFIIDEWDCIFREYKTDQQAWKLYLDFLRDLLKDKVYVGLAYMTGILPIHKYGSHSALNMFDEFSMTNPLWMARFAGFTQEEVTSLCQKYDRDTEEMSRWYNGYRFRHIPAVYSPKSVISAVLSGEYANYWNKTESYEALRVYIELNFDGLKDAVIQMLAGKKKRIDIGHFKNDMTNMTIVDDVLTLLIHLGYLGYDCDTQEAFIPNKEISDEFITAIRDTQWGEIVRAIDASAHLLQATWRADAQAVADAFAVAHNDVSHFNYNSEEALSYTLSLAYYAAREYYVIHREFPAGKGFADLIFLPRYKHVEKPAMIFELKWDNSARKALRQIEEKKYAEALKDYKGELLLIGVSYHKKTRQHDCVILCRHIP
jgi:hypothetical protein